MLRPMDDDRIITSDEPGTKDEVIAKAQALLDEITQLREEYDQLAPDEKAQMPESIRRFFGE